MGSVSPVPFADIDFMRKVEERIIKPTVLGIQSEKMNYTGFVFIGLMNVQGDPQVIEYNVRLGDPETESVIPRIKTDILYLFKMMGEQKLNQVELEIDSRYTASVVLVAGGYPENYEKGKQIKGLNLVNNSMVFHAGSVADHAGEVFTNGGRVLVLTSFGDTLQDALNQSYVNAKKIQYEGINYRTDIGKDLIQ